MFNLRTIAAVSMVALLAACGGGGSASAPAVPVTPTGNGTTQTAFTFNFPGRGAGAVRRMTGGGPVRPMIGSTGYSSRSTKSIGISVVATGSALPALNAPQFATNPAPTLNTNNTNCTTAGTDGSYSCTILIAAPYGYDDFQITEWDAANATPGFAPPAMTGNVLSIGTISSTLVKQNQVNTMSFQMNGVVRSAQTSLTATSMVSGTAQNTTVSVTALDADGNLITGSLAYVDASNVPVNLRVIGTVTPAGAAGDFTNLTSNYTIPGQTVSVAYTPTSGLAVTNVAFALSVTTGTVSASGLFGKTLQFTISNSGTGVPAVPQATEFATVLTGAPFVMIAGSDNNLYLSEQNGFMAQVTTAGAVTEFPVTGTSGWAAPGADNDVWYIDQTSGKMAKFAPSTTPVITETTTAGVGGGALADLVAGADGKMYVSNRNGFIGVVDPQSMTVNYVALAAGHVPNGLAAGPVVGGHPTVWFTDQGATNPNSIGYFDLTTQTATYNIANFGAAVPYRIAQGSNGYLYVTTTGPNNVFMVSPAGVIAGSWTLAQVPQIVKPGPDGNVWVSENNGVLGRITIASGSTPGLLQEYSATSNLPANTIVGIAAGSDRNLWFTDTVTKKAGKLALP